MEKWRSIYERRKIYTRWTACRNCEGSTREKVLKTIHPAPSSARHEIQINAFIETTRTRPRPTLLTWGRRQATEEVEEAKKGGLMGGIGWNNRAVYKPPVRRSVFRLCIKMTDNSRSYAGRLESSRCGDNDASPGSLRRFM